MVKHVCCRLAVKGKKVSLASKVKLKWVRRSTGGRVNLCATKQQKRSRSFQFKWSLLNEKEFLSCANESVFRCNILICRCMQKHIQHNKDKRTQFFRKIYLSLYLKGLRKVSSLRGELETEQNYNILTPATLLATAAFLSRSPGLLNWAPGGLGAQPLLGHSSHSSIFSPTDLNFLLPGLYDNLTPTYFLQASHLYSIQPIDSQGYPLIPWYLWPDAPVIYTGAFLIWQPGRVRGQFVTQAYVDFASCKRLLGTATL